MKSNSKKKRASDFTDEEMSNISGKEMADIMLSECVDDINSNVRAIDNFKKHIAGSFILTAISFFALGHLLFLIPLVFFVFSVLVFYRLKVSLVWKVRSFKACASMYHSMDSEIFIQKYTSRINKRVAVGELY
jgi:hypothetical protein